MLKLTHRQDGQFSKRDREIDGQGQREGDRYRQRKNEMDKRGTQTDPWTGQVHTHQADERVVLQGRARGGCEHAGPQVDALLLQELLDGAHVGVQRVQVPQLPVLLLGAADEEQQLAHLPPHEGSLLDHQVLGGGEGMGGAGSRGGFVNSIKTLNIKTAHTANDRISD